jgi:glycosyltransferase involved in cell wall biosynthesis
MRIAIDGHILGKGAGGVERFISELVANLPVVAPQHRFVVYVNASQYQAIQAGTIQFNIKQHHLPNLEFKPYLSANLFLQRLILHPWMVRRDKVDALLVQRLTGWGLGGCQSIVAIHDLTPIKFPQSYTGLTNRLVRWLTKRSVLKSALVFTPTKTIRQEILNHYPKTLTPIVPFYNGVDLAHFKRQSNEAGVNNTSPNISAPYWLMVGAIEARKNIEDVLDALHAYQQHGEMHLYLVGKVRDEAYHQFLLERIKQLNIGQWVHWQGFATETELVTLYQQARYLITASLDEGFNLPPLEAMACGTPVICSNIAVHRELFDGAVAFFKPHQANALKEVVDELDASPETVNNLVQAGERLVDHYSWTQTAKNVIGAIEKLASDEWA